MRFEGQHFALFIAYTCRSGSSLADSRQLFLSSTKLLHLRPLQGATFALVLERECRGGVPLGKKHSRSLNGGRAGGLEGVEVGVELCILTQRHG